ncbi:MAG: mycofactocin biosynthesis peptidyl-dipeptidase MftE [Mycobacteriaceae bacterium]
MRTTQQLGDLASREIKAGALTLIIPLGSMEQHGKHLPLDTDSRIATAVAESYGAADVVHGAAVTYAASGEHQGFPGTISIGSTVLTGLLVEFCRSALLWARRVVFVNGHGGNIESLAAAVALLRTEGRDVAWWPCAISGSDAHAGHTETSLLLHLWPELVLMQYAEVGETRVLAELIGDLRTNGVQAVSSNGILGDPRTANSADGKMYFELLCQSFSQAITRWNPDSVGMLR